MIVVTFLAFVILNDHFLHLFILNNFNHFVSKGQFVRRFDVG